MKLHTIKSENIYTTVGKITFLTVFLFLITAYSEAANPDYTLKAENFVQTTANSLEFDINLLHTNPDSSIFEFANGQYYFNFNANIANGGFLTYSIVSSDLPLHLQPVNPQVYLTGGAMQLRLSTNLAPGAGNGYIISGPLLPTHLVRMKLETSSKSFAGEYLNLRWRSILPNPYTKLFSYITGTYTEISNPDRYLIDSLTHLLPVELESFTAAVHANNIHLDWTTIREINNAGFDVERSSLINGGNDIWKSIGYVSGSGNTDYTVSYTFDDRKLNKGIYKYRLKQTDFNGNYTYYYTDNEINIGSPERFSISQNYPNPFNPSTKIDYNLPEDGRVNIGLYDVSGREVMNIEDGMQTAGYYTVSINAETLSAGVYFYKINVTGKENFTAVKRLVLVK